MFPACVICGTFHTGVDTHLSLCSTHNLWLKGKRGLTSVIQVEHFSPCDRSDDISISGSEAPPTYWLSVWKPQAPPTYWLSVKVSGMMRSEEFTTFWSDFICKIAKGMRKILSYALKMRQDYLSTRYLDQFISPSFRYTHSGDIFDPSNYCWDNPVLFWMHMINIILYTLYSFIL